MLLFLLTSNTQCDIVITSGVTKGVIVTTEIKKDLIKDVTKSIKQMPADKQSYVLGIMKGMMLMNEKEKMAPAK